MYSFVPFEELAFSTVYSITKMYFTFVENNMNGTATIVGSASSNNGNSQHIGDNIVLVTTTDHQMEITNSDHDIINNNILSMANGNATIQANVATSAAPTTTDEELTPLHWLHDKNLLKGTFFMSHQLLHLIPFLLSVRNDADPSMRIK